MQSRLSIYNLHCICSLERQLRSPPTPLADENTGIPHFDSKWKIEEHLRGTNLPYTILRPVFFMENWLTMKDLLAQGPLMLPLKPETILQQIAVDDIGAFAAIASEHPGKWNGTATDLAGDELLVDQIAQSLQTSFTQIPWEDFEKQSGPEMTAMFKWFENVGTTRTLRTCGENTKA